MQINDKVGAWTIIAEAGRTSTRNKAWLCKCECGVERRVHSSSLIRGFSKSCGCKSRPRHSKYSQEGEAELHSIIDVYKNRAAKKGWVWELSYEQCLVLLKQDCHYCGIHPYQFKQRLNSDYKFYYNGIDRIDNTKGYTLDNIVTACGVCNYAKGEMTLPQFEEWLIRLYNHYNL